MRQMTFIAMAILTIATIGCNSASIESKPLVAQVKPALEQYLQVEFGRYDDLNLTGPTDISVGSYNSQFKGWPVYADFKAEYFKNGMKHHHAGMPNVSALGGMAKMGVPVCYVCKAEGRFFCFKSKMAKSMDEMMETMQEVAFEDGIPTNGRMTIEQQRAMQKRMQAAMNGIQKPSEDDIKGMLRDSMPGLR